jgi:hypothetical protein
VRPGLNLPTYKALQKLVTFSHRRGFIAQLTLDISSSPSSNFAYNRKAQKTFIRFERGRMPTLILSNEQVVELVKQLSVEQQVEVFRFLLLQQWSQWESLSRYGVDRVRLVAQERGCNWDAMSEEERESLIDDIVHEE